MAQLLWHFGSCHYNRYNTRTCSLDHMGPTAGLFSHCSDHVTSSRTSLLCFVGSHYPRSPYREFPERPRLWSQVPSVYYVVVLSSLHERQASEGFPLCSDEQGPSSASPKVRGNFSLSPWHCGPLSPATAHPFVTQVPLPWRLS